MKQVLLSLALVGCGTTVKVKGGTEHNVSGDVKIVNEIVIRLDVSGCKDLGGEAQAACITESVKAIGDLVELAKSLSCKDAECLGAQQ